MSATSNAASSIMSAPVIDINSILFKTITDRMAIKINPDHLQYSFELRCESLSANDLAKRKSSEMTSNALLLSHDREKNMKGPKDTSKEEMIKFKGAYTAYNIDGGIRSYVSFLGPHRTALIGKLRRSFGKRVPITTFEETNQRFIHEAIWSYYDEDIQGQASNIKQSFTSIHMSNEYFDPTLLDDYIGKHLQIASDQKAKYAALSEKEQIKALCDGLRPIGLRDDLLASKDSLATVDDAFTAIESASTAYIGWLYIEERDHKRTYLAGSNKKNQYRGKDKKGKGDNKDWVNNDKSDDHPPAKRANEAKVKTRCSNCGNENPKHLALDVCDKKCMKPGCREQNWHFINQCTEVAKTAGPTKSALKKANKVTLIHEEDLSEVTNMKISTLPPIRTLSTSATNTSSNNLNISSSSSGLSMDLDSGRRGIDDINIIFDTGTSHMMSPIPLDASTLRPSASTLITATGGESPIESTMTYGVTDVSISSALEEILVNQGFIEDNNCSTFMANNRLFILNEDATKILQHALSELDNTQIISSTRKSMDNLYHLTANILHKIKAPSLHVAPEYQSAFIARYHTVQFANLKELVLYWHTIFRHSSLEEMIRIVRSKTIKNLPEQLTEEVIRKHFPALPKNPPCLDCALGSIALTSSPPSQLIRATPDTPPIDTALEQLRQENNQHKSQYKDLNDKILMLEQQLSRLRPSDWWNHSPTVPTECPQLITAPIPQIPASVLAETILHNASSPPDSSMLRLRGMSRRAVDITEDEVIGIGEHWQADDKTFMGDISRTNSTPIIAIGGFTHTFSAIDKVSGRVFGRPTKGTSNSVSQFLWVHEQNKAAGHTMKSWSIDKGKHSNDLKKACFERDVKLSVAIPDEHFGIGGIERWHRNIHEGIIKKSITNPNIESNMWALAYNDDLDMYNCLLTSRHPTKSPYQLFNNKTIDARLSPMLPFGSIVVAQIPLSKQTLQTGRGIELIVVGRYDDGYEGILCFNPKTKRTITRRSIKFMGDHPVKGLVFSSPIDLEEPLSEDEYSDIISDIPLIVDAQKQPDIVPNNNNLHYSEHLKASDLHASQKKFIQQVNSTFAETIADGITTIWRIAGVVRDVLSHQIFFQYHDATLPIPTSPDNFEYTPCSELLKSDWADFKLGKKFAKIIKNNRDSKIPNSYEALLRVKDDTLRNGLIEALHSECASYWDTGAVGIMPNSFDWSSINPKDIGDLMILFSVKHNADGSFDKYKCRIVFRGDRWNNVNHLSTYSSSAESDAINLIIATAASEGLDLFSADVKTAFLHGRFPEGMEQYVRSPRGLPNGLLPRKFKLSRCAYGHPLAGVQWEEHSSNTLYSMGFRQNISSASTFNLTKDGETIIAARVTDDILFMCKYGSPLKEWVLTELEKHYTITTRDPIESFVGLHITRDHVKHTATLTQPKHINGMEIKYPLTPGAKHPVTPMLPLSPVMSMNDKSLLAIPLTPSRITDFQQILGDISWIAHKTRPDVLFSLNTLARKVNRATELDYKYADRIVQYIIGTRHLGLTLGSKKGAHLIATVDTSYATHADMKSHSSWDIHMGEGGSLLTRTKKQSIMTDSSTLSELVGAHMSIKDIMWCRHFLSEIGYPQRSATTLFIDNTSTLKIIKNKCNSGKTRSIDIRYNLIRELIDAKQITTAHLSTDHMIADMGTKVLSSGPFLFLRNYLIGTATLTEFTKHLESL
jgi:hypothetical protein